MISFKNYGNFEKTFSFFKKAKSSADIKKTMEDYAQQGVIALQMATPKDTGNTAMSWTYEIVEGKGTYSIFWNNDYAPNGVKVAILIQYGHATRNGGYVQGIDYINPALEPYFKKLADDIWKEVTE